MVTEETVSVRYMVNDVPSAVDFYTKHFGFTVGMNAPAFADVFRGNLRLLLSGPRKLSRASHARRFAARPRWLEPDPLHRR